MRKQLSLLSKLQSFDNRLDSMCNESSSPTRTAHRKPSKKQRLLADERDGLARAISEPVLRAYERMRGSRLRSNAVVPVINGVCHGCFMVVTKSVVMQLKRGNELVLCEHCGRILFLSDTEAA